MIRSVLAIAIGTGLAVGNGVVRDSDQPASVSLALLYDVTMAPWSADIRSDPRLKLVLSGVSEHLANQDTVQVGFVTGTVIWSRTFGMNDRSALYSETVNKIAVPVEERIRLPALCDALYEAVSAVAPGDGRRAVVVVTSGHSGGNVHSFEELVAHAREMRVSLSAVQTPWPGTGRGTNSPEQYIKYWSQFPVSPSALLTKITSATGGTYVAPQPGVPGDLKQRLTRTLEAVHQQ